MCIHLKKRQAAAVQRDCHLRRVPDSARTVGLREREREREENKRQKRKIK